MADYLLVSLPRLSEKSDAVQVAGMARVMEARNGRYYGVYFRCCFLGAFSLAYDWMYLHQGFSKILF